MRAAIASIVDQDYPGPIEVLVVFDHTDVDESLTSEFQRANRQVGVLSNRRMRGLAGTRNTGIAEADSKWVAFCDDDDTWLPAKLTRQFQQLSKHPESTFCTSAMEVLWGGHATVRLAGQSYVTHAALLRSRMAMLHSSSFVILRDALLDGGAIGPVDETLPGSMAEDWDLLLRASRTGPILHVDEPLIRVLWGASSYFNDSWRDKNAAHEWLLEHYPEMEADRTGYGLMLSKLAFGHAALGDRPEALRLARSAIRVDWRQPRTLLALAVAAGVPAGWIVGALNRRGRGI